MDQDSAHWRRRAIDQLASSDVSYRQLAKRLKMDYSTIQRQLSGRGSEQGESLYFVRRLCREMGWSMPRLLFGDSDPGQLQPGSAALLLAPWLDDAGVDLWLSDQRRDVPDKHIQGWFAAPSGLPLCGERVFVWQLRSTEFTSMGFPPGSYSYVDPDRWRVRTNPDSPGVELSADDLSQDCHRLLLCRLKSSGGLLMKKMDCIGNELWLLPGDHFMEPHTLSDVDVLGAVVGCFRNLVPGHHL